MSLSQLTGATVEQVAKALDDAEKDYRAELAKIRKALLAPNLAEMKRQNANARTRYATRRSTLERYRDALVAEGPTAVTNESGDSG